MWKSLLIKLVRHGLTVVAGVLAANGLAEGGSMLELTGAASAFAGGTLWSVVDKADFKASLYGVLRHVLTAGAGYLAAEGYIDHELAMQIVGIIMALVGGGASAVDARQHSA